MKRSEINKALKELEAMCQKHCCYLPPFCHFTPEQWESIGHEYDEVRDCMLGWDITDYGLGDFDKFGFSLITIRNGNRAMADKYPKVYAEKLLYLDEGQTAEENNLLAAPMAMHTHVTYPWALRADTVIPDVIRAGYTNGTFSIEHQTGTNEYEYVASALALVRLALAKMEA